MDFYSIRYFEYLDEYLRTLFDLYSMEQSGVLTIYYNWDKENSITEDYIATRTGTYELFGDLSGYKWNKILYLPVHYSTNTSIENAYNEHGLNKDIQINITIPDHYGIYPTELDFIFFLSNYQMDDRTTPVFKVNMITDSHFGHNKFYNLTLNTHYASTVQLDNQISNIYVFVEVLKKIYNIDDAECLLKTLKTKDIIRKDIKDLYVKKLELFSER